MCAGDVWGGQGGHGGRNDILLGAEWWEVRQQRGHVDLLSQSLVGKER